MKNRLTTVVLNQDIAPSCFRMLLSGQFDDFHLQPGQFIMLKVGAGYDPLLRRPFAAVKVKTGEGIFVEIFYKVVGHGTRIMSRMVSGTVVELLGPLGNGFTIPDNIHTAFVVAGGMGIVSLRGLVHRLVDVKTKNVHMFLGAKSRSHVLFQEELNHMLSSLHLATEDGSAGYHGFVTELFSHFLERSCSLVEKRSFCFACGPSPMLAATARITSRYQLPCQVSLESRMACGIGACLGCSVKLRRHNGNGSDTGEYGRVCSEGPVFLAQEIEW